MNHALAPASHPTRVAITGGTGFLGRVCTEVLIARGYAVHVLSRTKPVNARAHWLACDVLDHRATSEALGHTGATALLHLAWSDHTPFASSAEYQASPNHDAWLEASRSLFNAFAACAPGGRIVAAGSALEYGTPTAPSHEDDPVAGALSHYAHRKRDTQLELARIARTHGLRWAWARLFPLYGRGASPRRIIARVTRALLKGDVVHCPPSPYLRDLVVAADAAEVVVRLMDRAPNAVVNVGSGVGHAFEDVLRELACLIGRADLLQFDALMPDGLRDEAPVLVANVERERTTTGFVPSTPLAEGLASVIDHCRAHAGEPSA